MGSVTLGQRSRYGLSSPPAPAPSSSVRARREVLKVTLTITLRRAKKKSSHGLQKKDGQLLILVHLSEGNGAVCG